MAGVVVSFSGPIVYICSARILGAVPCRGGSPHDTDTKTVSGCLYVRSWLHVKGERCVVSSWSLFERFEVNKEEEED